MANIKIIGGEFCNAELEPQLLPVLGQKLTPAELKGLWKLFQAIGYVWKDTSPFHKDSSTLKSSWLEFIEAKTETDPSYTAEYSNAVLVVEELKEIYKSKAYKVLFLEYKIPIINVSNDPKKPKMMPLLLTRIAHAKKLVVDEFIRVNVIASGFKSFGGEDYKGKNYKGYIGGSRYNLRPRVRAYNPEDGI